MPELPDITIYLEALSARVLSHTLEKLRLASPFVLRTYDPPAQEVAGKKVVALHRLGKRIVFELEPSPLSPSAATAAGGEGPLYIILHLMIAGRLKWLDKGAKVPGKVGLAAFDFDNGTLVLTEAGSKRRASLHIVRGEAAMREHDRGGIEPLEMTLDEFRTALTRERHTLKRTLTDPNTFSGIGNAYSDEILHRARLSPVQMSTNLAEDEIERLYHAIHDVLVEWIERLRAETGTKFPEKVTAFRPEMAVHGKYDQPCPVCGTPVQRIVYADNETNYCARCQTNGKLLADRALSRLLNVDWPKSIDDL